jgi:hypothetical protein
MRTPLSITDELVTVAKLAKALEKPTAEIIQNLDPRAYQVAVTGDTLIEWESIKSVCEKFDVDPIDNRTKTSELSKEEWAAVKTAAIAGASFERKYGEIMIAAGDPTGQDRIKAATFIEETIARVDKQRSKAGKEPAVDTIS